MLHRILEPEAMDGPAEARDYDRMDFRAVNDLFAAEAARLAGPNFAAGRILDLGAGTARIPILIARRLPRARILAVDLSPAMLAIARVNLRRAGPAIARRIRLRCCDAKTLPVPAAKFDFVLANSIVHHIPEPAAVFAEIARVARPGAGLFIKDLLRPTSLAGWRRLVARYTVGCNRDQRRLFADSLRAALTLADVARLVRAAGLTGATVRKVSDRHWTLERPC
ncbi:MAG: class I SAM-dependent methyltransferase [Planctomycetota bacterium]